MQKVVINKCFGGFGLSTKAVEWMRENDYPAGDECKLGGEYYDDGSGPVREFVAPTVPSRSKSFRTAEGVIDAVETLGEAANGEHAMLKVVEIPEDIEWEIDEYDGRESIAEKHRVWG